MKVLYTGCFFDYFELQAILDETLSCPRKALSKTIPAPHITFSYRPDEIPWELIGEEVLVRATGYASDKENEALLVEFVYASKALKHLVKSISVPHITLSISPEGKAVNSSKLHFKPISPFTLSGTFGCMCENYEIIDSLPF